jgi:AcrR family transcriptional regulator
MDNDTDSRPLVKRLKADERRRQIVQTAFDTIAEDGFEGLRTRDVAARAGINSATLHHYFPTKEDLIEGVAAHLESLYSSERAPEPARRDDEPAALRELRQEFADVTFVRRQRPRTWAVSREFTLRASRDDLVAKVITRLHERWHTDVERILVAGRDAGVFRRNLDPVAAASAVVGALWGSIVLLHTSDTEFDAVCREIESWLVSSEDGS